MSQSAMRAIRYKVIIANAFAAKLNLSQSAMRAIRYKAVGPFLVKEIPLKSQSAMRAIRYKGYLWKPTPDKGSWRENRRMDIFQ